MKKENIFRYIGALLVVICAFKIIYDYNIYLFTDIKNSWSALVQLICYALLFISLVFVKKTPAIICFVILLLLNVYNFASILKIFFNLVIEWGFNEMYSDLSWFISLIFINLFRFVVLLIMLVLVCTKPTTSKGLGIAAFVLSFIYSFLASVVYGDGTMEIVFSVVESFSFLFIGFGWPSMFSEEQLASYIKERDYKKRPPKRYNDLESLERLEKLKNLLDSGAITQEEYNEKKKELLRI